MSYNSVTTIVEGAVEEETNFTDYALLTAYLTDLARESLSDGYGVEVYILHHAHEPGECECIQYATDHKPRWVFPRDAAHFEAP